MPGITVYEDIRRMDSLPAKVDLLTAGFPCQDLSPAGRTGGIFADKSSLVWEAFRLIDSSPPEWVLLENVPFMLRLSRGAAMTAIVTAFEVRGYRWAYRVIDTIAFGLPQRRPRVFILASRTGDPRSVLLSEDRAGSPSSATAPAKAFGFYWTEGNRGIGWAIESVPALKGGSGLGIPSAPAIILPSGAIGTPHIADAERLQGFPLHWTAPAMSEANTRGCRWRLIGNAVSPRVTEWIGRRLLRPRPCGSGGESALHAGPWPDAACGMDGKRWTVRCSRYPVRRELIPLHRFVRYPAKPLSLRAASGVLSRLRSSSLRVPDVLFRSLEAHVQAMSAAGACG